MSNMDDVFYVRCRRGIELKRDCKLDVLVFRGRLHIMCKEHGLVHVQAFIGSGKFILDCEQCKKGATHEH